jgi:hypothetical protein
VRVRARECAIFHREGVSNRLCLFFFCFFFKYLAVFFKSILLGYVCTLFKYLAIFFKSIEIYSSHYSSVHCTFSSNRSTQRLRARNYSTVILYPRINVRPPSNLQRASPTRQVTIDPLAMQYIEWQVLYILYGDVLYRRSHTSSYIQYGTVRIDIDCQ